MTIDGYTKVVLTIIAIALTIQVLRPGLDEAHAQSSMLRCKGTMTANAFGGEKELVGGYDVDVTCR